MRNAMRDSSTSSKGKSELTADERALRRRKTAARIIALAIVISAVSAIAYGIHSWTRQLNLRRAERVVREAMELVIQEKGEEGLIEIVGALENFSEEGIAGLLPVLGYDAGALYDATELQNIEIYERFNSAVVNISTELFQYNTILGAVPESGTGSGIILDNKGHILTNFHVIDGVSEVIVSLYNGSSYNGKVIGRDRENDLAIVKIEPEEELDVTPFTFGSSADLKVGQKVLAIGNPFGYDRTLTTGIISGLGRPLRTESDIVILNMIQTDASINPGNSGGPLLDSRGLLIGINSSIHSTTGASVGIGFAVPIDTIKRVVPELIENGRVVRGWLDLFPVQLDERISEYAGLPVKTGILVSKVEAGSKAAAAGIRGGDEQVRYGTAIINLGGDIIVGADGMTVEDFADLFSALEDKKPGDVVEVVVIRNGQKVALPVELTSRPVQYVWD
jgi:S1-C subfamily serine protease